MRLGQVERAGGGCRERAEVWKGRLCSGVAIVLAELRAAVRMVLVDEPRAVGCGALRRGSRGRARYSLQRFRRLHVLASNDLAIHDVAPP